MRESPPPDLGDAGGGGGGDWALLTVAKNMILAYLIQGRLVQQGIDVLLDSTNLSPAAWLHPFGDPSSPVRIFVHRLDMAMASLILHEVDVDAAPVGGPAVIGPAPGGAARGAVQVRRRSIWRLDQVWLRVAIGVLMALAALAVSGVVAIGPCVSHWFCV
ncbi:MAG TPA: hypothetical protein VFW71_15855 [Actinomycetota bacterium]|nr:hypothetical protein [Actinomycetota bacterium]